MRPPEPGFVAATFVRGGGIPTGFACDMWSRNGSSVTGSPCRLTCCFVWPVGRWARTIRTCFARCCHRGVRCEPALTLTDTRPGYGTGSRQRRRPSMLAVSLRCLMSARTILGEGGVGLWRPFLPVVLRDMRICRKSTAIGHARRRRNEPVGSGVNSAGRRGSGRITPQLVQRCLSVVGRLNAARATPRDDGSQARRFRDKFGRDPRPEDPIFLTRMPRNRGPLSWTR